MGIISFKNEEFGKRGCAGYEGDRLVSAAVLKSNFSDEVHVLSDEQGRDATWRVLRRFKFTSSITSHMLAHYRTFPIS